MLHFSKTARNFFIILSLRKVNNISFHMNLVSQLAALVCQPGVHKNIENKSGDLATFWQKLPGHDYLRCYISPKRLMILSLGKVDNISFHMNLVSQLAALVCQPGVHRNKDRRKQLIRRNLVISLYDILLDDIFLKNGSKLFSQYIPCLKLTIFPFIWT